MHSRHVDAVWNVGLLATVVATVGLLATALFRLDSKFDRLDGKIDALGTSLNGSIDALERRMDVRFNRLEDGLEQHLQTPH